MIPLQGAEILADTWLKAPLVSVVVLTRNRRQLLVDLVAGLHSQDYPNYELIVVDNASEDGAASAVQQLYPDTSIIPLNTNEGFVAYDHGFRYASGKYIAVIDDDGFPANFGWLTELVKEFEANPRLGAAACSIRMSDTGRIAHDSPQFLSEGNARAGFPSAAFNGTGAALRTEALREVGGYPHTYYRTWLELHLCTRLIEAGWEVRCFPSIEVWHRRPSATVDRPITYYGVRNYFWYVWTFYPGHQAATETIRHLAISARYVLGGKLRFAVMLSALFSALSRWRILAASRVSASGVTLNYLHQIRLHGTRNTTQPEYKDYSGPTEKSAEASPSRRES